MKQNLPIYNKIILFFYKKCYILKSAILQQNLLKFVII